MCEASLSDIGDRIAPFARSQAKVDILKAVDERLVESAAFKEPIRAHGHGRAGDAQRITRSGDDVER